MTRVRVTAPRSVTPNGTALNGGRSAAASLEAEEETDAGQLFVRSLIRSQPVSYTHLTLPTILLV